MQIRRDKIVIYSTSPVKLVVGEVEVLDVIENVPDSVWGTTAQ